MKQSVNYTYALLLVMIGAALGNFSKNSPTKQSNVKAFFTGLFNEFGLFPTNIEECFPPNTYANFTLLGDYANYLDEAVSFGAHSCFDKKNALYQEARESIRESLECVEGSPAYRALINSLNFTYDEQDHFPRPGIYPVISFYFQYLMLGSTELPMAIFQHHFNNDFYRSGELYGKLMKEAFQNKRNVRSSLRALELFMTGLFSGLQLDSPKDMIACFNYSTAITQMSFYYEWANIPKPQMTEQLSIETITFFQSRAREIMEKIPPSVIECVTQSESQKKMNDRLKTDINGQLYASAFFTYIHEKVAEYEIVLTEIVDNFNEGNIEEAGKSYAEMILSVIKGWETFTNDADGDIENI